MATNLSLGDEIALRRASERELLLGNHHHLGTWWIDMSRSRAATCLDSWSTGGHSRAAWIVTLRDREKAERKDEECTKAPA